MSRETHGRPGSLLCLKPGSAERLKPALMDSQRTGLPDEWFGYTPSYVFAPYVPSVGLDDAQNSNRVCSSGRIWGRILS